jgi:hypothetical protein
MQSQLPESLTEFIRLCYEIFDGKFLGFSAMV